MEGRFQGGLADVRVWTRVRTQDEIKADLCRRLTGLETGLVGHWPLGNESLNDRSTQKRHGVAVGNPAWQKGTFRMPAVAVYGALDLRTADDYATLPGVDLQNKSFTLSFWARRMRAGTSAQYRSLAGTEAGLLGYWPMDDGKPYDYTPRKLHGRLYGDPQPYLLNHTIAGQRLPGATACFAGEMADVRIWGRALGEWEIKDSRNLLLTGKEPALGGYYRLGAVKADAEDTPIVPDFSAYGRHARAPASSTVGTGMPSKIPPASRGTAGSMSPPPMTAIT